MLFGETRTVALKKQLENLHPEQREPIVLNALVEALREGKSNYVLPFKFYSSEMARTSHFIIFVTKHPIACKIMKQIMYSNSAKDSDGVATFSFKDSHNFVAEFDQLTMFDCPLQMLKESFMEKYRHQNVPVAIICDSVDCDFSNYFVGKNAKDALRQLEAEGKIEVISGRKQKYRKGQLTMPDTAMIQFR